VTSGIIDTGGKFINAVNDSGGHIFPEIYIDRGDNSGKFAISVNDAGNKLPPVPTTPAVKISPVLNDTIAVDSDRNIRLPTPKN
jgi:hypothetical protein